MDTCIAELLEPGGLKERLETKVTAGRVAVALAAGGRCVTAETGGEVGAMPIGCIAKLLTASLACKSVERGHFALDTSAAKLLDANRGTLRGVTVRHLLEHAHGFDDSLLAPPRERHGCADGDELVARVAELERWAAPGAVYSYGNAGAWLVGAALERLRGRTLAALARTELLTPIGIAGAWPGAAPRLCAATGAGLSLTAEELVRFGLHTLEKASLPATEPVMPLPGWHPLEAGVCLGWKYAGAGWFGHQAAWPRASSYLRVQPQRKLALAVVAREQSAAISAIGVFGAAFPELFAQRSTARVAPAPRADAAGVYRQAARIVVIESTLEGLRAEAWERDERGRQRGQPARVKLVPMHSMLFAQPVTELVPYLQRVGFEGAGLWNSRSVLRRAR
jgi:CubicO group peptidase (beta-lactamase class C family)